MIRLAHSLLRSTQSGRRSLIKYLSQGPVAAGFCGAWRGDYTTKGWLWFRVVSVKNPWKGFGLEGLVLIKISGRRVGGWQVAGFIAVVKKTASQEISRNAHELLIRAATVSSLGHHGKFFNRNTSF
jgi:hypothetical protein